jgi:hypothetical protein
VEEEKKLLVQQRAQEQNRKKIQQKQQIKHYLIHLNWTSMKIDIFITQISSGK